PSEHQLADRHGVSRITARSALQELERRHAVRRHRGSGTFVARRLPYPIRAGMAPSWSGAVRAAGHEASHRLLTATTERATAAIGRRLLLPRGRSVVRIERLGSVDGEVAAHQCSWLPSADTPRLAEVLGDSSLTETLQVRYGLEPARWWSRAELRTVPAPIARLLELPGRPMAWRVESVNRTSPGAESDARPIEYTVGWLRADSFRVLLELGPTEGDPSSDGQPEVDP
ncbi:MAG: GntR family transcriptional regulator, partial [Actinomycetota bacterium]